tara:strand:- start:963 stop:1682 length:720 start_codon:yes stop_codon:yes gene_type:complete
MAYKASKSYGSRGERKGSINFRIHYDDSELMRALKEIQGEGQDELRMLLNKMMQKAKKESEEFLLDQRLSNGVKAGSVKGETPNGDRNVYVRIAESLRVSDDALFVRLFSKPYPSGYLTTGGKSRSGFKLAMAHSAGVGSFNYSANTPLIVKSSVSWFLKTGYAKGYTRRPDGRKPGGSWTKKGKYSFPPSKDWRDGQHPGFEQVDFIGVAQDYMEEHFEREAKAFVEQYLLRKGFEKS